MSEETVTTQSENVSPLDALVAAKGNEDFRDVNVLANSKLEADRFIEQLKKENEELKSQMANHASMEETFKQLDAKAEEIAAKLREQPVQSYEEQTETPSYDPSEVQKLVQRELEETTSRQRREANINAVNEKLGEMFGAEAGDVLAKRARELDMTHDEVLDMAGNKPAAFLALMNVEKPVHQNNQTTASEVNTASPSFNQSSTTRNYAFYERLRKENHGKYMSKEIQLQMQKDAMAQGDEFFKT